MAKNIELNIEDVIKQSSAKAKTFQDADKKVQKQKRKTVQISVYLNEKEIEYVDKKCEELFSTRPNFLRKLVNDDMAK